MTPGVLGTRLSWWALLLLGMVALIAATEIGHRLGLRHRTDAIDATKAQTSLGTTALLALLGLLLAFSFSIVEGRFGKRKALVLEEANAIGTTYLRAGMLPDPHDERVRELLREYVEARLDPRTIEDLDRAVAYSERTHAALWREATTVAEAHPESEVVSIFVRSLNDVIDLHEARVTVALHQRLPLPILSTLLAIALLSALAIGFGSGLDRRRLPLATLALLLAVASVVVLIVELDQPGSAIFRVNQSAMRDTLETIEQDQKPRAEAPRGAPR